MRRELVQSEFLAGRHKHFGAICRCQTLSIDQHLDDQALCDDLRFELFELRHVNEISVDGARTRHRSEG